MKQKILIIEDNEQNLYLVKFLLERHGYEISDARDGRKGIEMAFRIKPDLILLDIELPVMDGYAVAKNIRKNHDMDMTPIVAVTSYAMMGDREKAMESGCTGYIEKPIDPETFLTQVEKYIKDPLKSGGH